MVDALSRRDGAAVLAAVDGLRGLGLSAAATLEELAQLLQQMAVEQAVPGALDAQDPDTEDARALASTLAPDETQLLYSMVLHGREELSLMSDEYGALTMVLLRFLAFPAQGAAAAPREARAVPLRAPAPPALSVPKVAPVRAVPLPAALGSAAAVLGPQAGSPAAPVAAVSLAAPQAAREPAAPARVDPPPVLQAEPPPRGVEDAASTLGERWNELVKTLVAQGAVAAMVRELAFQAGLRGVDDQASPPRWQLLVAREPLRNPALADKLAAALGTLLGHPVVLDIEAGAPTDTPALRDAAERQRRQEAAQAVIEQDPVVRELLLQFKTARIVPGSIKPV
jgi:DNA polymerase-3 subunit gamma/tau